MKRIIIFSVVSLLLSGTCTFGKNRPQDSGQLVRIGYTLEDQVLKAIQDYVQEHPAYNTFVFRHIPNETLPRVDIVIFPPGYLIGPANDSILQGRNLDYFMDLDGKRVYFLSDIYDLVEPVGNNTWENTNPADSVVLPNGEVIRDSWKLYVYRCRHLSRVFGGPELTYFIETRDSLQNSWLIDSDRQSHTYYKPL